MARPALTALMNQFEPTVPDPDDETEDDENPQDTAVGKVLRREIYIEALEAILKFAEE